jgi:tetratricopeptide (TPR) repeat protein
VGVFQPAVHRAIVIVDVENFGDPARSNAHQLAVRETMYEALRQSFDRAGIAWDACVSEDRGDGVLVLVPPDVPKSWLVIRVPIRLAEMLAAHNAACQVMERIRLRMALHAGEVQPDAHGWAGVSVNRAFRLIEAPACRSALRDSSGVLALIVSDWFYDEVVRHHPAAEPASFRQVHVAVKETDMMAWVRVLKTRGALARQETGQLTPMSAASAEQAQPLPTSALQVRFSLPPDTAAFTGRDEELERITAGMTEAAAAGRVVAVHAIDGMPGIGKTTLAVHAAHLLKDQFPERQLFINLQAHTPGQEPLTPQAALAGLLTAIGVEACYLPPDLPGRTALWRDRMAGQRALLVLDNAAGSAQVAPLLPGSKGCLVLVTSRRYLGDLPGAVVPVLLGVLAPTEAREMFVRLAPRAAADSPEAVAELVRLTGFLPLAISLLARIYARQPSWSLADLAAETRASLLTLAAERDTVAAAFDVSYRHLNRRQQRFFRCLGLHPGTTIDAYAAAALAGVSLREAARHLHALHSESLLTQAGYLRYGMHDVIRRYARDRAAAGPAAGRVQALERLLDYYQYAAALADTLLARHTPTAAMPDSITVAAPALADREGALAWARAERVNLLACLDHATGTGQHARIIALTAGVAALLRHDGPWIEALNRHATALRAAQHLRDRPGQARILYEAGAVRRLTGDFPDAAQALEEALRISRDLGDQPGQANALSELGAVRRLTGDFPDAAQALEEALRIYHDLGDRPGQANALHDLGHVRWHTGDYSGAAPALQESLGISRDLGDRPGQANALLDLGNLRYRIGDYPGAIEALEEALEIHRSLGDRLGRANVLLKLGVVGRLIGNYPGAAQTLEEALSIFRDIGSRHGQADTLGELGVVWRLTADYPGAAQALEEALGIVRDIGDRSGETELLNEAGTLHRICGDLRQARSCHQQALKLARQIGSPWNEAHSVAGLARCALAAGRTADAQADLRQAQEIFQRIGAAESADVSAELDALAETQQAV